jgi:putative addiction module killer protein
VFEVRATDEFRAWLVGLRDQRAAERIAIRIARLRNGLLGDTKSLDGVGEMRVDYGPGYRVYFVRRGALIVLLCGGDKQSQDRDIKRARKLAEEIR